MPSKKAPLPLSSNTNPKARKPKAKAKAKAPAPAPAEGSGLSLTESERLRLRTYFAEHKRHSAEATLRVLEKQALVRQLDPDNKLGLLDQAIRAASQEAARAQEQHTATMKEIEKRLGINIQEFSFDSDTGRLWPHPAAPTKE